ncbi:MAG: glycerol-3-phosphate dehydrogenase [Candidatus Rokuibacteriota bacterium]|nr:MAG: glycerol-3-phosphate dehydrogenase [Candidatus Rokubacteria bacterium]
MSLAVVGAGSWGTALATHLGRTGREVRLWVREPELLELIGRTRENPWFLPGVALPPRVIATGQVEQALDGAEVVVVAVPSEFFESVVKGAAPAFPRRLPIVSATKGLDPHRHVRMTELLTETCPEAPVAALSGPTFAREVALGRPTAAVVACTDDGVAHDLQQRLGSREFRLYVNRDVVGVEIGGALKNVMAIATGLSDGLGLGENARAALITRGLAEITRLGVALGASPGTFAGLAGIGDLVLTCTGSLSRNRALGLAVAAGRKRAEVEAETRMIAEGVRTIASALALARQANVTMPICTQVGSVLFDDKPAREALADLLSREMRREDA